MFMLFLTYLLVPTSSEWVAEMENQGMFEGDMLLSQDQLNTIKNGGKFGYAATIGKQWPNGVIPYKYALDVQARPRAQEVIQQAITDYHAHTCLKFVKRTNESKYIEFYLGSGCSSRVGVLSKNGPHHVSLAQGCWRKGIVIHELGHAIGFFHEQSRPDRDEHVKIHFQNITSENRFNFNKQTVRTIDSLNFPYDYESIMHYSQSAWAKIKGYLTIETLDPSKQRLIGNRKGFSKGDIAQINALYKCDLEAIKTTPSSGTTKQGTTQSFTTPTSDCKDKNRACNGWLSTCKTLPDVAKMCPRTCNQC